jgi:hypothetical protein
VNIILIMDVIDTIITSSRASNGTGRLNRVKSASFEAIIRQGKCVCAASGQGQKCPRSTREVKIEMMSVHRAAQLHTSYDDLGIDFLPGSGLR